MATLDDYYDVQYNARASVADYERYPRLYRSLSPGFTYANAAVIDIDDVLHRGTQEYHLRGGRGSNAPPI